MMLVSESISTHHRHLHSKRFAFEWTIVAYKIGMYVCLSVCVCVCLGSPPLFIIFMRVGVMVQNDFTGIHVLGPFVFTFLGTNGASGVNIFGILLSNVDIYLKEEIIEFLG